MIEILRVINPSSISEDEREKLIGAVEKYGSVETPSVVQQLASLTPKDTLSKEEQEKLQDTFSDLHFGKGLEQRRDLDKAVLSVLDIPESEQSKILSKLYPELLKEIFYLKQMMDSD
jgi:O-phosphoseryl-tRNA(Cys) synthetase